MSPFLPLLLVLALAATTVHAALVTSPNFPIISSDRVPIVVNGQPSTQHVVTFRLNELNLGGRVHIDNRSYAVNCDAPAFLFSYEVTAKVPMLVLPHSNEVCSSLNPDGYNASRAAQIERILATPFGYANRRLFIFGEAIAVAALIVAEQALSAANSITDTYNNFHDNEFEPFRNLTYAFLAQTTAHFRITDQQVIKLNAGFSSLNRTVEELNVGVSQLKVDLPALAAKTDALAQHSTDLFNEAQDGINLLRSDTQASLIAEHVAIQLAIDTVFNVTNTVIAATLAESKNTETKLQGIRDTIERSLAVVWDTITQKKMVASMTRLFYNDLSFIGAGRRAMVGQERIPPADPSTFQPSDKRLLFEKVYVNYIRRHTGPTYGELVNTEISFFADTAYAIENFGPGLGIDSLIRRMGPTVCNRSFTALDSNGHILPELSSRNASNTTCRLWVEVRTLTCQAKNQAFNWSHAIPSARSDNQNPVLQPDNCTSGLITGLTAREQVFSDYVTFMQWFTTTICGADLWTTGGQAKEYMMTWTFLQRINYPIQPSVSSTCSDDLGSQSLEGTPYFFMLAGIQIDLSTYLPALIGEKTQLVRGQLPAGLQCFPDPVPYMPIRRDSDGNLINDGNSIVGGCTRCYWLEASETLVNVYSVAQLASEPVVTNCVYSAFEKSSDLVTDYLVDSGTITGRIGTPLLPYSLPLDGLWYGDFDDPTQPLYDVPNAKSSVDGSPYSRKNTVGSMNQEMDTTVLKTYEEFVRDNGGFWSPIDGAVSISSYAFQRGVDLEGYPFCVVGGGIPVNLSISAYVPAVTELAPDAFVAQSIMCNAFKKFKISKVARAGTFVLRVVPRKFEIDVTTVMPDGYYTEEVTSFCPSFELRATGGNGYQLVLFNTRDTEIKVVLTLRTNITSEIPFCTKDDTVTVPGAPASVFVYKVPQCAGLNITVQRIATRPEDSAIVLATCEGSPITASSLLSAARAYTGIPTDITSRIVLTDTNTGFVDNEYVYTYLQRLQAQAEELTLFGFPPGESVAASLAARLRQLQSLAPNVSLANTPLFFHNPLALNLTGLITTELGLRDIANLTNIESLAWAAAGGKRLNDSQERALLFSQVAELSVQAAQNLVVQEQILVNISLIPVTARAAFVSGFGLGGFEDALVAIVKSPIAAVEAITYLGKGFVDGALAVFDGVKGFLSSAFGIIGTIIQTVIMIAVVGAVLLGVYFLVLRPMKAEIADLKSQVAELRRHNGLPPMRSDVAAAAARSAAAALAPADAAAAAAAAKTDISVVGERAPLLPSSSTSSSSVPLSSPTTTTATPGPTKTPTAARVSGFFRFSTVDYGGDGDDPHEM